MCAEAPRTHFDKDIQCCCDHNQWYCAVDADVSERTVNVKPERVDPENSKYRSLSDNQLPAIKQKSKKLAVNPWRHL